MQLKQSRCSRDQDLQDSPNSFDYTGAEDSVYPKKNEKQFSLTLLTPERGEIALPNRPVAKQKEQEQKGSSDAFKKKDIKSVEMKQQKMTLPSPKFSKLGPIIYCVYNANIISIFEYNKEARGKKKKLFQQKKALTLSSEIKFVKGNNKLLLIAFENQFTIMRLDGPRPLVDRFTKTANSIIGGCFEQEGQFVIVTRTSFTKYYMRDDDIITLSTYKMDLNLGRIKFIELLKDLEHGKYLLIVAQKRKVTYNSESKTTSNAETRQLVKDGEALQIIELGFTSAEDNAIYQVSSIPQQGVFELSKAFFLGQQSFLLSLFQEIIVVRKQFSKYIVVDNTAIASMNTSDDTKTGQLLLVDKQKVVYNDHEGINVYNLLFVPKQDKIKMQSVDNFSPIDQSQLRLYDGLLLQSGDTNLQILFYFDNRKIMRPGKKNNLSMEDDQKQQQKYKLKFSVYAIVQSQPIQRLIELLKLKRPQIEINEFRTHFNISPLEFYKSQWSVSQKSLNDIINNLLEISDEQFIQSELDTVLKKQSTTLNFLIKIEEKQVTRLKKVIISKMQAWQEQQQNAFIVSNKQSLLKFKEQKTKNKQELIKIIKKLLQSKMFLKKLRFQNEFQAYKIIDFIEINKLRQMSLREQIKLLSSKGYEKRLKQFLNQFKYLAIANFEGIFQFLMENKNEKEAQDFLFKMGFLFPLVINSGSENNATQTQSTRYHHEQSDDSCYLWDNFENLIQRDKNEQKPETIESLVTDLFPDQNLKSKYFRTLMQQFIQTDWFKVGAFKKHCQLSITYEQLVKQFNDLKNFKVYNIIYKYLFQKIQTPEFRENIIISLFDNDRLPQTIRVNMRIRQKVYAFLVKYKLLYSDIKVSDFLILNQRDYFKYITIQSVPQNVPQHLLFEEIKNIYENTIEQYLNQTKQINNDDDSTPHQLLRGFFQQCFQKSMQNTIVTSDQLKFYLNQFIQLGTQFQRTNQDLLEIIIKTANKTFKISGNSDEILAIANLFFKIDLSDKNPQYCSVFLEIAFFNGFWKKFDLNYTFHDLCQQQFIGTVGSNKIILEAIQKYCKKRFVDPKTDPESDNNNDNDDFQKEIPEFQIYSLLKSSYEKLEHTTKKVNIRKPAQFFQFLILMTNQIGYSQKLTIPNLEYFLLQMLENEKYEDIKNLNVQLYTFIKDKNPDEFLEQLIIKHVREKQQNSGRVSEIYDHVINSLNLIVPVTIRTKQQKAILQLCKHIESLDYRILSKIPNVREMLSKPPLVFMMEIWLAGSVETISSKDSLQVRLLMQNIYEKYKQATSFDINFKAKASFEIQFLQFQIQRGYQYIERKMLEDAVQICKLLSNQDKLYFGDLVYSLTCQIARNLQLQQQNKEAEALRLVKYSIQHNSMIQIVDNLEDVMRSKNSVEFNIEHALNLLTTFVEVVMLEERGDISHKDKVYYQLFFSLLPNKPIQAFYFLMKNKNLDLVKTIEQLESNKTLKISKQAISKHLSLAIYIRSLGDVVKDFYPTYSFFQKKEMELSSEKVKKDINYLAEKLNPNRISQYLLQYYDIYMKSLSLSGYIDLTQIKQDKLLDIDKEMNQYNKQYLRQKQQIQQSKRKYEQLMKTINAKPKPVAPLPTSQHSIFKPEKSQGSQERIQLPSKKLQKYEQIKRRQMHDLKKVQKEFVRQQSTNNVDKILQMFKERKQQRLNNLRSEENNVRQRVEQIKNKPIKIPERQQVYQRTHLYPAEKSNDPAFQIRQRMLERPTKQRINQELRKRNIVQKPQKPYTEHALSRNPSQKLNQSIISNLTEFHQQGSNNISKAVKQQSIQYSLDQLKRYLQNHNELEVLKYLQKFELIYENMTLGKEFIKRMFDLSKTFEAWMKVIQFIIKNYESYSQIYEIKSLKLCSQSLKIAIKIDPKKLFNLPFFMFVTPGASQQKYNHQVFEHLKTNLVKLLDDSNVEALAKAFFYGMGLIRKYQYMIYIYYLDAKLEQYLNTAFNSKQQQYLLQRLKSVYAKLGADMRQSSIKDLFRAKINTYGGDKLKILIRLLQQSVARSSKLRNVVPSADDSNLLKLLKSI